MKHDRTLNFGLDTHMTFMERSLMEESSSIVSLLNALLREACALRASDIHLDPGKDFLGVRLRVDGLLQDCHQLPILFQSEIIARLKVLAHLRTDEHQSPQEGRFRFEISSNLSIDVRLSIAPTYHGENAVLRLLSSHSNLSSLSNIGLNSVHQKLITSAISKTNGLILATGPTGSGKTSTLYALIHQINTASISIVTIEDPVEHAVDGINQIPVSTYGGLTFAEGLRSILRQDPNVIGVGEIRDSETAALAANAALTGHLVLSTLHTTTAPLSILRLADMGVEKYLISSTLSLVISQRLMRRLCTNCKKRKNLRKDQKEKIAFITDKYLSLSHELFKSSYESLGCVACNGTGISGRLAVFEVMSLTNELREAIGSEASGLELSAIAHASGMEPILCDGLRKAIEGQLLLDDVLTLATHHL